MTWGHCNKWLACGGLVLGIILFFTGPQAHSARPQNSPPSAPPPLAEQQFKNIKNLKGAPADQVIPSMQFMAASLGVDCEYCHVHGAFEKDDKKPKLAARRMMTMMMAINKDNFEGHREVTCYSCHRGAANPVSIPIISAEEAIPGAMGASRPGATDQRLPGQPGAIPQPALPPAADLLEKYLAASGGAALAKISSQVQKGTITAFGNQHFPFDIYTAHGKRVTFTHLPNGDSVTGFDGRQGWQTFPGRPAHMTSEAENNALRLDADLSFPANVKTLYQKFTVEVGEKIDGHDTYLVVGSNPGQPALRLYLDQQSGLLLREVRYADTLLGLYPTQIDYSDYRDASGVKVPFRWITARPGSRSTTQIDQLQQNVPIDEAKFAPPPPSAPAPAGSPGGGPATLPPSRN
ncbi:MAG: hypothetical protein NVS9B4_14150 [Candidatus Acidiferrum sp.]